ncbi:MAG: hypothetical protein ACYC53_13430, partial [Bacillota bacterium]
EIYAASAYISKNPVLLGTVVGEDWFKSRLCQVTAKGGGIIFTQTLNNVLFWVFLLTALSYFFFTVKRENKLVGWPAWFGRWVIMVGLGAAFGNTVMARISLFIGRLQFLFINWLQIKI